MASLPKLRPAHTTAPATTAASGDSGGGPPKFIAMPPGGCPAAPPGGVSALVLRISIDMAHFSIGTPQQKASISIDFHSRSIPPYSTIPSTPPYHNLLFSYVSCFSVTFRSTNPSVCALQARVLTAFFSC